MKLTYQAPKRSRINYRFSGFTTFDYPFITKDGTRYGFYGWNETLKQWDTEITPNCSYSSSRPCRTVKAFRRMLKDAPYGVTFILNSRWVGHDVYGKGTKK